MILISRLLLSLFLLIVSNGLLQAEAFHGGLNLSTRTLRHGVHGQRYQNRSRQGYFSTPVPEIPSITLYASNKNDDPNKNKDSDVKNQEDPDIPQDIFSYVEEPRLIACDLLAFLIVCEFIGLTDVLVSSGFWKQGGFLQPVTMSSFSTVGLMIKRDSLMSICWILSSIYNRGYSYSAIATDIGVIKSSFTIFTDYCSLLILSALAFAAAGHAPVDSFELVREAWFTILIVGGFRFAYSYGQRF